MPNCFQETPVSPTVCIRQLTAKDEGQFIQLLRAIYGESYSYNFLYEPGGFSSLVNSNTMISYGEFDNNERLLAHTAFFRKENNSDYVESGCSFRLSGGMGEFKTRVTPKAWHDELQKLASRCHFIHQHNSTLHVLAQRYAARLMNAQYCGLILGYTEKEEVKGVNHDAPAMHALIMTTVLQSQDVEKNVYIPELFREWLTSMYQNLGLHRTIHSSELSRIEPTFFHTKIIETNPYINLQRRLILNERSERALTRSSSRTDLIHLPLEKPQLVHNAFYGLIELGYFPCGLRPHAHQADELIFQNFSAYKNIIKNLSNEIKIAHDDTKREIEQWQKIVLQIM